MALTNLTQTTFDAMLKEIYTPKRVENVATKRRPFLKMVPKIDDFEGDTLVVPVQYEMPVGVSADFSKALANGKPSKYIKWNVTIKEKHAVHGIDALTVRASRSNKGAFARARKREVDGMLRALGRKASIAMFRDGRGHIGINNTTPAADPVMTLATASDTKNFAVGQLIYFATDATPPVLRDSGATLEVASVEEADGTVTFTANLNTITGLAVGDLAIIEGDISSEFTGLAQWLPLTAPTSGDSHFGVDRSVHANRLAGARLNKPAQKIEESILELAELITEQDGDPDCCFISHTNYTKLVKSLGSKVEYTGSDRRANVGFRGVVVHTSAGELEVYADPDCPSNRGYILQMDSWAIHHLDPFPHLDNLDGLTALRQANSDGLEVRARAWGELVCHAPAYNGVFAIS